MKRSSNPQHRVRGTPTPPFFGFGCSSPRNHYSLGLLTTRRPSPTVAMSNRRSSRRLPSSDSPPPPKSHRTLDSPPSLGLESKWMDPEQATRVMLHKWDLMSEDEEKDGEDRQDRRTSSGTRRRSRVSQWEEDMANSTPSAPNSDADNLTDYERPWSRTSRVADFRSNYSRGTLGSTFEEYERSESARGGYPSSIGTDLTSPVGSTKSFATSIGIASESEWESGRSKPSLKSRSRRTSKPRPEESSPDRSPRHHRRPRPSSMPPSSGDEDAYRPEGGQKLRKDSTRTRSSRRSRRSSTSGSPSSVTRTPRSPTALSSSSASDSLVENHKLTLAETGKKALEQAKELPAVIQSALSKMMPTYFHSDATAKEPVTGADKKGARETNKPAPLPKAPPAPEPISNKTRNSPPARGSRKSSPPDNGVGGKEPISTMKEARLEGASKSLKAVEEERVFSGPRRKEAFPSSSLGSVKAEEEDSPPGVVIIGGGDSAFHCIDTLTRFGYDGKITLITRENVLPYDRTTLSKSIVSENSCSELLLRQESFYKKEKIQVRLQRTASRIDLKKQTVTFTEGGFIRYETLVIATGTVPRQLKIPARHLGGIFTLHSLSDAQAIATAVAEYDEDPNIVIVGSSLVATEFCWPLSKIGNVTVVGRSAALLEPILGKRVGDALQRAHEQNGVVFRLSTTVTSFVPSIKSPNEIGGVQLSDGTVLPADIVIMAVGVKPATTFLKSSKIPLLADGSIEVDSTFRVRGVSTKNVFAMGEVTATTDPDSGKLVRINHWASAGNQGRAVAAVIGKRRIPNYNRAEMWWSAQGQQQLRYVGTAAAQEWKSVVIRGDLQTQKFVAYYGLGTKIVAVCSMQSDPIVSHCAELLRRGRMPSLDAIRNRVNPLDITLK